MEDIQISKKELRQLVFWAEWGVAKTHGGSYAKTIIPIIRKWSKVLKAGAVRDLVFGRNLNSWEQRGDYMRTIKFRAWDKKEKEMVDINSLEIYDDLDKDGFYSMGEVLNNEDWEVMQFTGLKDKNGKEIYERDLIEWKKTMQLNALVTIMKGVYQVKFNIGGFIMEKEEFGETQWHWLGETNLWSSGEVIGNIYENPELLK